MSTGNENKQQTEQKEGKKPEETPDWMTMLQDFIKNPVTTGVTGLAAGYIIGTHVSNKNMEALKEEHKQQMQERDEQFKMLVGQIQATNKMIASKLIPALSLGYAEDEEDESAGKDNTLQLEENKKTKVYKYNMKNAKKQKHIHLLG